MVFNPTRSVTSSTGTGAHICKKAGGSHDKSLLPPSPYLSLEVDWVAGKLVVGSYDMKRIDYHIGK
jgi:hypothetical protein